MGQSHSGSRNKSGVIFDALDVRKVPNCAFLQSDLNFFRALPCKPLAFA
jgi:hypothetical protein